MPLAETWTGWSAAEQMRYLRELPEDLSATQLAALDETLGLSDTGNNEVRFLWLEAALRNEYRPAVPQAEQFSRSNCGTPPFALGVMACPEQTSIQIWLSHRSQRCG